MGKIVQEGPLLVLEKKVLGETSQLPDASDTLLSSEEDIQVSKVHWS